MSKSALQILLGNYKGIDKEELAQEAKDFEAYAANKGEHKRDKVFNPEDKSKVTLNYFSESRVNMCRAVINHPQLCMVLNGINPETDWEQVVAEIAAYCNVALDGAYVPSALEKLYQELYMRLTVMPVRMDYADKVINVNEEDVDPANWDKYLHQSKIYTGGK